MDDTPVLDRVMQLTILKDLRDLYPAGGTFRPTGDEKRKFAANLAYLGEHGLCEAGVQTGVDGHISFGHSVITAAGLDFLADDGGLSAILGVVNVKIHADTLRDLIAAKIDATDAPEPEKSALKEHLGKMGGTALQAASTDLVKLGLDHLPNVLHIFRDLLGL